MVHLPLSRFLLEMVVMAVLALSDNVKTHIETIPMITAEILEADEILLTTERVNSS